MIMIGLLSTLACKSDIGFDGTLVGNPGRGIATPAETESVTYDDGIGDLNRIEYAADMADFETEQTTIDAINRSVDILDPTATFQLLPGRWAALKLHFNALELYGSGDVPFELHFNAFTVTLQAQESSLELMENGTYVVEMGNVNWLIDAVSTAETTTIIDSSNPMFVDIKHALTKSSAIYNDEDGDGELSEEERAANLLATGDDRNDHLSSGDDQGTTTVEE